MGRFYLLIDSNFQTKRISSRPDNIYMFIQRLADSSKLHSEPMLYGVDKTVKHLHLVASGYRTNLEEMSEKVSEHQKSLQEMKIQMEEARTELIHTRHALSDITKKLQVAIKQRDCAHKQVEKSHQKLETVITDSIHYEEEILAKNEDLSDLIKCLKSEISTLSATSVSVSNCVGDSKFCFQTKDGGRVYTTAVRELYYTLLAMQLPPSKIATTIKSILKSFLPSLDVDNLKLPGESCASYMRRQELTTLHLAHKATCLLDKAQSGCLNLNCDGTTLSQKKLQGAAIDGMILSVNEISRNSKSLGRLLTNCTCQMQIKLTGR